MKQFLVFLAMVSLGCFLFQLVAGDDNSVYSGVREMWQQELVMEKNL
ncbi:MAG: hypothetical protein ACI4VM_08195 [Anaerovoracaceae bacterium]